MMRAAGAYSCDGVGERGPKRWSVRRVRSVPVQIVPPPPSHVPRKPSVYAPRRALSELRRALQAGRNHRCPGGASRDCRRGLQRLRPPDGSHARRGGQGPPSELRLRAFAECTACARSRKRVGCQSDLALLDLLPRHGRRRRTGKRERGGPRQPSQELLVRRLKCTSVALKLAVSVAGAAGCRYRFAPSFREMSSSSSQAQDTALSRL